MASNAHSPDFIKFLFSSKPKFDCYFEVGNESQGKPERIGAVKLMLMAHSEVFRLKLEDCELQEKQDVPIKDIHPDTFKGILKNVYGHDTTPDMEFDEADNMFYVADKYMIKTLKDKLAMRLIDLLNPDNICSLLKNPACHTNLELDSAITEILRYETDCVLANPQFLWMDADKFLRILQQDELVVPEIELWRAAIKWAKHKANSEDGQMLRQQLSGLTPQLRPYALTAIECHEVISSDILTKDEIKTISLYHGKGVKPQDVGDFSKETEPRKLLENRVGDKPINRMLALIKLTRFGLNSDDEYQYTFTLLTKKNTIELLPLVCQSRPHSRMDPVNLTYKVENTTTITKGAYQFDPPTIVTSSHEVKCGEDFEVPLAVGGRNITLLPNTKYTIKMKLVGCHKLYWSNDSGSGRHGNNHLTLDITPYCIGSKEHWFPSDKLKYRIIKSAE